MADQAQLLQEAARFYNDGEFERAAALISPALAAEPGNIGLVSMMGQIEKARGNAKDALGHFDVVLARFPGQPEIRSHRAMALLKLGRKDEAKAELEAILEATPSSFTTLKYLAGLYGDEGANAKAEEYLTRALAIDSDDPEALWLLGKVQLETERLGEARATLKRSIRRKSRASTPFTLLGASYRAQCRFRTALSFYRYALKLAPGDMAANVNYGVGLLETGQVHAAIEQLARYLETDPSCDQARFNMAMALLQIGRLEEGWAAYEARRAMYKLRDDVLPYPSWEGEPLAGKTIIVLAEQGVGDEIWAANMYDDLVHGAAHCLIECDTRLVSLFTRSFPAATIIPRLPYAIQLPKERQIDFKVPGMSVARWLRSTPEQFPGKIGYLLADPDRRKYWRWRLAQLGPGMKVGISWRSMNVAGTRSDSYTSLAQWGDIFAVAGVHFVNLQYGKCQEELQAAEQSHGVRIHSFQDIDLKDDMDDVAALMSELDLVIAPDNTVSAMAAALNAAVLQFVPSKYWSCHGKDYHPWYPSVHLFFRPWDHEWQKTLRALAKELERRCRQLQAEQAMPGIDAEAERSLLQRRISRAAIYLNSGKFEKARDMCREILAVRPGHSDAMLLAGIAEKQLGNVEEAEKAFREATAIDPDYAEAHNQLGALLLTAERIDDARAAFLSALEIRPTYPDALSNLGNTYAAERNFATAADCYRRAITALSGFLLARYNLALTYEHLGRIDDAIVEYETVVEGNAQHAEAWNNLANLYAPLGRTEETLAAYRRAVAVDPEFVPSRINLAKLLLKLGRDVDEAVDHLEVAAAKRDKDASLANTLGVAYARRGDMEQACENFRRAIAVEPGYADAYRNLGVGLQKLGRLEEAREALMKGLSQQAISAGGSDI